MANIDIPFLYLAFGEKNRYISVHIMICTIYILCNEPIDEQSNFGDHERLERASARYHDVTQGDVQAYLVHCRCSLIKALAIDIQALGDMVMGGDVEGSS